MKKKILSLLVAGIMTTGFMVGCGSNNGGANNNATNNNNDAAVEEGSDLSGTVTVTGSTTVFPIAEAVAAAFMDEAEYSDIFIEAQGVGSSDGIRAAIEGTADLGMASRELKDEEASEVERHVIAYDGIAVVVHPNNPVSDLTMDQIRGIYTGEISNWSEVGGDDAEIAIISREDGSGTRGAFEEIVDFQDELRSDALIQDGTGAILSAVAGNEQAIGYISLGRVDETVKALAVDGAEATVENVLAEEYKVQRPLLMVSKDGEALSAEAQAYLDYVLSAEGQAIVEEEGFIGVN